MQQANESGTEADGERAISVSRPVPPARPCETQRGCYGIQILIAGRRKSWRDGISAQVRRAGFNATTVDSAVDALTVLVLGLPVDVLLTDIDLHGDLGCTQLASEARALRPNLGIILASELDEAERVPDVLVLPSEAHDRVATTVREALASRAA